jgi:hypothetical protein
LIIRLGRGLTREVGAPQGVWHLLEIALIRRRKS